MHGETHLHTHQHTHSNAHTCPCSPACSPPQLEFSSPQEGGPQADAGTVPTFLEILWGLVNGPRPSIGCLPSPHPCLLAPAPTPSLGMGPGARLILDFPHPRYRPPPCACQSASAARWCSAVSLRPSFTSSFSSRRRTWLATAHPPAGSAAPPPGPAPALPKVSVHPRAVLGPHQLFRRGGGGGGTSWVAGILWLEAEGS